MAAGLAAARVLRERGVRFAFGVPGESFLGLLDGLSETPDIQLISTRHEGAAAFMADAVGKLTGVPAICMGTRGVGSANLAIGLHTAFQDSTPLIALVGQVETPFRHREAFQEVELASFLSHITKWAIEAPSGARLPELVSEAHRQSITGRPGPVAIALRGDILEDPVAETSPEPTASPVTGVRPADIAAIGSALQAANRPLIIAGGGILRAQATGGLVRLAERFGVPVVTAFRRHDAFPNDHPLYLGPLSFGAAATVAERARNADVILAIGTRLSEPTTLGYSIPSLGAQLIQIDIEPSVLGRTYPASIALAADAGEVINLLNAYPTMEPTEQRRAQNSADRAAFEEASVPSAVSPATRGVDPAVVVAEMNRQLPAEAIITSDAGNFWGWIARSYRFVQPGTLLGPCSGAMGYAVPAAVAAAVVTENRVPVIACAGDGGFMMTGSELAVAAQLGLNLTCLVFDNAMYGTIRLHQERTYPGRTAGTSLWSPDFVRYAEAFGGWGRRLERNQDIAEGLAEAIVSPGISILSIAVDSDTIAVGQTLSALEASARR